LSMGAAHV